MESLEVKHSLVSDLAGEVRAKGKIPDTRAIDTYVLDILRGLDRKESDRKPKTAPRRAPDKEGQVEREFEKRTGRQMEGWTLEQAVPRRKPIRTWDEARSQGVERLRRRIRWIMSKPDLKKRLKALSPVLVGGKKDARERAAEKMRQLIADSDRLYGREWWKPEPTRLYSK